MLDLNMDSLQRERYHVLQSHLYEGRYVYLIWPKETPLRWLNFIREIVDFQIDAFRDNATRDEPLKEYARIEVESWSAPK